MHEERGRVGVWPPLMLGVWPPPAPPLRFLVRRAAAWPPWTLGAWHHRRKQRMSGTPQWPVQRPAKVVRVDWVVGRAKGPGLWTVIVQRSRSYLRHSSFYIFQRQKWQQQTPPGPWQVAVYLERSFVPRPQWSVERCLLGHACRIPPALGGVW